MLLNPSCCQALYSTKTRRQEGTSSPAPPRCSASWHTQLCWSRRWRTLLPIVPSQQGQQIYRNNKKLVTILLHHQQAETPSHKRGNREDGKIFHYSWQKEYCLSKKKKRYVLLGGAQKWPFKLKNCFWTPFPEFVHKLFQPMETWVCWAK